MKKTKLLTVLNEAYAEGKNVQIFIENPTLPRLESIDINNLNIPSKIEYYESSYDEDCQLIAAKQIRITNALVYSVEQELNFRNNYVLTHWCGKSNSNDGIFVDTDCLIDEKTLDSLVEQKIPQFIKILVGDGEENFVRSDNIYNIRRQY